MAKRTVELTEEIGDFGIRLKASTDGEIYLVIFHKAGGRELSCNPESLAKVSDLGAMLQNMVDALDTDELRRNLDALK